VLPGTDFLSDAFAPTGAAPPDARYPIATHPGKWGEQLPRAHISNFPLRIVTKTALSDPRKSAHPPAVNCNNLCEIASRFIQIHSDSFRLVQICVCVIEWIEWNGGNDVRPHGDLPEAAAVAAPIGNRPGPDAGPRVLSSPRAPAAARIADPGRKDNRMKSKWEQVPCLELKTERGGGVRRRRHRAEQKAGRRAAPRCSRAFWQIFVK
jgi:hypothetical protein